MSLKSQSEKRVDRVGHVCRAYTRLKQAIKQLDDALPGDFIKAQKAEPGLWSIRRTLAGSEIHLLQWLEQHTTE